MWNTSRPKGPTQKAKKANQSILPKHMTRTGAQLKVGAEIMEARIVLNDFGPNGVELYSTEPLNKSQKVSLTMEHPKRFYSRALVVWCEEIVLGNRIISEKPFRYRMRIQFVFDSKEQESSVKDFAEEIQRNCIGLPIAAKPTSAIVEPEKKEETLAEAVVEEEKKAA